MHRGYHVLAVPTWERKIRVLAIWLTAALFGRDIVSLASVQHPRQAFITDGELTSALSGAPAATRATAHSVDICSE
jgi:NADH dehydrogenase